MRILQVVGGWHPTKTPSTGTRHVMVLSGELRNRGHEVALATGAPRSVDDNAWSSDERDGLTTFTIHQKTNGGGAWPLLRSLEAETAFGEILAEFRPDLVHVHDWLSLSRSLVPVAAGAGIPSICSLYDARVTCPKSARIREGQACVLPPGGENCLDCAPMRWYQGEDEASRQLDLYRDDFARELDSANLVIVPSLNARDFLASVHPALDRDRVLDMRPTVSGIVSPSEHASSRSRARRLRLAYLGPVTGSMELEVVVEAMIRLPDRRSVFLDIYGTFDPHEPAFERQFRGKLQKLPIKLVDPPESGCFPPGRHDLAIFPCSHEQFHSFGVDLAWAAGLPVILPDTFGAGEYLGGAGGVFEPGNSVHLAELFSRVMNERSLVLDWQEAIRRPQPLKDHVDRLESTYEKVAGEGARAVPDSGAHIEPVHIDLERQLADRNRRLEEQARRSGKEGGEKQQHQRELEDLRENLRRSELERGELDRAVFRMSRELESRSTVLEDERNRWEDALAGIQTELVEREREIEEHAKSVGTLQGLADDLEKELDKRQFDVEQRDTELEEYSESTRKLRSLLQERDALLRDRDESLARSENVIGEFSSSVNELKSRTRSQEKELRIREAKIATRDRELQSFSRSIETMKERIERMKGGIGDHEEAITHRDSEILELTQSVRVLEGRIVELMSDLGDRDRVVTDRDLQLREFQESVATLKSDLSGLGSTVSERDESIRQRDSDLEGFRLSVADFEEMSRDRGRQVDALESERQRLEDQEAALEEELRRLTPRIEELTAEMEGLISRNQSLEEICESAEGTKDQLDRERGQLAEQVSEQQKQMTDLKAERENLSDRVVRLNELLSNTQVSVDDSRERALSGERALARAIQDLAVVRERENRTSEAILERLVPIGEESRGGSLRGAEPEEVVEHVVANHDRLHGLLSDKDEILGELTRHLGDSSGSVSAGDDADPWWHERMNLVRSSRRQVAKDGRIRILFVLHDFLPNHCAGTEIYTYNLARNLSVDHDVQLMFCEARHELPRYTVSKGVFDGLPFTEVVHNYQWENFEETYHDPRMEEIFASVLEEQRPDIVHFQHLHYFSMNFVRMAKDCGLPVVYTLHEFLLLCARGGQLVREGGEICELPVAEKCADCISQQHLAGDYGQSSQTRGRGRILNLLPKAIRKKFEVHSPNPTGGHDMDPGFREAYAGAAQARLDFIQKAVADVDLFISPSAFLREKFIEAGMVKPDRIIHSDNGFDVSKWHEFKRDEDATIRFGFVGTIADYKGVHVLIDAFNEIEDDGVELQIWGDLDTFEEYKARIVGMVNNPRIRLMGRFDNDNVAGVIGGLDILVVPSLWFENSPLTIHEAWLGGIGAIVSNRGGMAELVDDGVNGLHFELGSASDLRSKIRMVIDNPDLLGEFSRNVGRVKTIEENADEIESYYRNLLSGGGPVQ